MQCETVRDELASGYLAWEDVEYLAVARHLEGCAGCREQRDALATVVSLLAEGDPARALVLPARPPRARWSRRLLAVAAVLCAALAGFWLGQRRAGPTPVEAPPRIVEATPEPVAAQPVSTGPQTPVVRLDAANLRALRVREFALRAQVALALRLAEDEQPDDLAGLVSEGWELAAACEQAGERQLAQLLGYTSVTLEQPERENHAAALAELRRLRLGISFREPPPETAGDDIL